MAEALEFQGGPTPQPLHHGPDHNVRRTRLWLYRKGHRCWKMLSQSPASRRLTLSNAAKERINRTAACVNVGVATGGKSGAATSVCGTMNTFNGLSWFWKIDGDDEPSGRAAFVRFGLRCLSPVEHTAGLMLRMSALPHPPMRIARWTSKAALSISQSGLHIWCVSFPWHTSALVEVSDSISARALSIAGAATRDQACEPLSRQAHYFCSAPLSLAVRLAGARAFSPAQLSRRHRWLARLQMNPKR
jgi:hypothetical protein